MNTRARAIVGAIATLLVAPLGRSARARTVSALLRDVRGVRVERVPRGQTIVRSTLAPEPGCAAGMLVVVDGTPVRGTGVADIDRMKASSVAAVEVYSSPGSPPPEFRLPGAESGIVLIWTAGA